MIDYAEIASVIATIVVAVIAGIAGYKQRSSKRLTAGVVQDPGGFDPMVFAETQLTTATTLNTAMGMFNVTQQELRDVSARVTTLETDNSKLGTRIEQLEGEKSDMEKRIQQLETEKQEKDVEIEKLKQRVQQLEDEMRRKGVDIPPELQDDALERGGGE